MFAFLMFWVVEHTWRCLQAEELSVVENWSNCPSSSLLKAKQKNVVGWVAINIELTKLEAFRAECDFVDFPIVHHFQIEVRHLQQMTSLHMKQLTFRNFHWKFHSKSSWKLLNSELQSSSVWGLKVNFWNQSQHFQSASQELKWFNLRTRFSDNLKSFTRNQTVSTYCRNLKFLRIFPDTLSVGSHHHITAKRLPISQRKNSFTLRVQIWN